ncbi:MAG: glycosyltransferase, partial [Planctomycetota bacterium]
MRITIVTGPFWSPPPAPGGAVERRWFHVAERFAAKGNDVTFLSRRHDKTLASDETIKGVRHHRRLSLKSGGSLKANLVKDALYTTRMLATLPKADVLVTNTFWMPVLAPRLRGKAGRVVVNVARAPKGQMKLYKKAALLVAPSTAVAQMIRDEVPDQADKAIAVANPIDTDVFRPDDTPEPETPTIVYTGRVHPEKGLTLLAEAHRTLRERL